MPVLQKNQITSAGKDSIPRLVYVLTGCVGVIGSNSLVLGPIAPEVSKSLSTPVPMVMVAAAVFGLGAAVSSLFLAHHIDRLGAQRILKIAMALLPIALLLCAIAPHLYILVAAQLLAGVSSGVALPAIYATAAGVARPGKESRTVGIVLTGWTFSMVAGVSLSAVLADLLNWRAVYIVVALFALLALIALSRMPVSEQLPVSASTPMPLTALALPGIRVLLIVCALFMAAFYGVYGFLGDYLHSGLGLVISVNGLTALAYGVGFGGAVFLDRFVHRVLSQWAFPITLLTVSSIYFLIAFTGTNLYTMLALLLLLGLMNHFSINMLIVRLTEVQPAKRGTIMGLYSAVTNLAVFVGTLGFAPLYAAGGFVLCAYVAMTLTLIAAIVCTRR